MFEHATTLKCGAGQIEAALRLLRQEVVPVVRAQPGLQGLCLIPDAAAETITVITLWASPAHARAAEGAAEYQRALAGLDALIVAPAAPAPGAVRRPPRRAAANPN